MSNSQALTVHGKYRTLKDMLQANAGAIAQALPRGMDPDRMGRTALIAVKRNPRLLECDSESFMQSCLEASALGLEVDGVQGHAFLVPYYDKKSGKYRAQMQVGYKGQLELARRSGQISTIDARVVYEGDAFEYRFGLDPTVSHVPCGVVDPEKLKAAYAVCKLKDGSVQFDVMLKVEIERIKSRSKTSDSGPWVTDTAEMWRKTVLRRLSKFLPLSAADQRILAANDMREAGEDPGFNPVTGEVDPPDDGTAALDKVVADAKGEVVP